MENKAYVVRPKELDALHQNEHPEYEYMKRMLVAPRPGSRCRVSHYELPSGKSNYPYHYHMASEESFYILSGSGTLRTPEGERKVSAGDFAYFPCGEAGAHKLTNTGTVPLVYLDFDTLDSAEMVFYPDSGKVGTFAPGVGHLFRQSDEVDYYEGE